MNSRHQHNLHYHRTTFVLHRHMMHIACDSKAITRLVALFDTAAATVHAKTVTNA